MQDVRDAFRALRSTPLVTAAAVLSLALGIGANTALFSLLNAILFRPLPVSDPERLVLISSGDRSNKSWPQAVWQEVRDRRLVEDGFAWYWNRFDTASGGERAFVEGLVVSGRTFESLGLRPALGRLLTVSDEQSSRGAVAVISYQYWQRRFDGATDVIGRSVVLDRRPFTIVGVTPRGFSGLYVGLPFDIAVPLGVGSDPAADPLAAPYVTIMGRIKPGQRLEGLTAVLRGVQPQIRAATNPYTVSPYREEYLQEPFAARSAANGVSFLERRYAQPFKALLACVAAVLLIACGNVAMLSVARTVGRRRELGVRAALGASRLRLARQLAVESLVLSLSASCLGLLLAQWCATFVAASLSTQAYSVALDLAPDWRVLAFTACVCVVVSLLFGIAPGFLATRTDPLNAIRPQLSGTRTFGFGNVTVVAQVALSLMLLAGMGLFLRSFFALSRANRGFDSERVLVVSVERDDTGVSQEPTAALYRRVLESVARVPGVESADYSLAMPGGNYAMTPWIELSDGTTLPQGPTGVYANRVGPAWFRTLGTRVLAGRSLEGGDGAASTPVVLVNETFVRRFLRPEMAIGSLLLERSSPDAPPRQLQVVGVVEDAMYRFVRESPPPTVYLALAQAADDLPRNLSLSVRTREQHAAILSKQVAVAIGDVDRSLSLTFRTLSDQVSAQYAQERLVATMAAFFGFLALLLAALGLYGLAAYATAQRQFELGVRLALGASPVSVVRLLLGRLAILVVGGAALGMLGTLWAGQFVRSLLFGVEPSDGATVAAACIVLSLVAAVAVWVPARRASRFDLTKLLRDA